MGILEFGIWCSLGLSFVCAANASTHSGQLFIALSLLESFLGQSVLCFPLVPNLYL